MACASGWLQLILVGRCQKRRIEAYLRLSRRGAGATREVRMLPGVSLTVLRRMDGPVDGYETVMVDIVIPAGTLVPPHTHPGVESTFVFEGTGELHVDGQPPVHLAAGDSFQAPPDTVHFVRVGERARVRSTLVVRKGEPITQSAAKDTAA
jgi:quercetin dioxygenase-like cupin family protein